jgi:hypothetical protein
MRDDAAWSGSVHLRLERRSAGAGSGLGPVHPVDPRPEEGPEGCGAAGERERHPAPGEDEAGAGAQDTFAQAACEPAWKKGFDSIWVQFWSVMRRSSSP